ncbi:MAG: DUF5677 domain-containing protein [Thermodesulfobacteriota bacterium]
MDNTIIQEILFKKLSDLFQFIDRIIRTAPDAVTGQRVDSLIKAVVLYHYVRSIKLLQGIYTLCESGNGIEATILLRSLLNLYINLKWLTQEDIENRMTRFAEFEVIYKKLTMDKLKESRLLENKVPSNDYSVHDKDFETVKTKYNLKSDWDLFYWSGKSIRQMAEDLGLERDYYVVYGYLSKIEHTSPSSVRSYLDDSIEGVITISVGPSEDYVAISLITSPQYFLPIKKIVFNTFGLGIEDIDSDYVLLRELDKKYGNF